jgi:hypothetical protein
MHTERTPEDERRDDETNHPGAKGGESASKHRLPLAPAADDDTPAGDTDQHSNADA